MIYILDSEHLLLPVDYAIELADLLDHLADILRYGGDDLHDDIDQRYQPGKTDRLVHTVEHHAGLLRPASTSPLTAVNR